MSTIINALHFDGIEVHIHYDGDNKVYNVDVNNTKLNDNEDKLIVGYTGLQTEDDAEFLARAWISGYQLGRRVK